MEPAGGAKSETLALIEIARIVSGGTSRRWAHGVKRASPEISITRKTLGEKPGDHRYIVTVPARGYRFVADVRETAAEAVDLSATPRTCWIVWRGREIALHDGDNIIGRDPGAAVRLDLPSVSRRHARIVVSSDGAVVEDLGSKNGTFLGKDRITSAVPVADLDELQVGSGRLTVRILSGDVVTQTVGDR